MTEACSLQPRAPPPLPFTAPSSAQPLGPQDEFIICLVFHICFRQVFWGWSVKLIDIKKNYDTRLRSFSRTPSSRKQERCAVVTRLVVNVSCYYCHRFCPCFCSLGHLTKTFFTISCQLLPGLWLKRRCFSSSEDGSLGHFVRDGFR